MKTESSPSVEAVDKIRRAFLPEKFIIKDWGTIEPYYIDRKSVV